MNNTHIPEFIADGNKWIKNTNNVAIDSEALFTTVEGIEIHHGDGYWAFTDLEKKDSGNWVIANKKFNYTDGIERFKHKITMQDAINAFTWLNS